MSHESLRIVLSGLMGLSLIVGLIASWTWILVCLFTGRGILPARLIVRVPWREGSVVAVILLYVGLQVALGTALIEIQGRPDGSLSPQGIMLHSAIVNGIVVFAVPALLWLTSRAPMRDLGLCRENLGKNLLTGTIAFFVVAPSIYLIFSLALKIFPKNEHKLEEMLRQDLNSSTIVIAFLSAVVMAPIAEEILFRGVLLGWLTELFDRPSPEEELEVRPPLVLPSSSLPVVFSSIVFGAVHYAQMPAPIAIFFLSVALGVLRQRTGSLIPSIVLHALFNACSTFALILGTGADD